MDINSIPHRVKTPVPPNMPRICDQLRRQSMAPNFALGSFGGAAGSGEPGQGGPNPTGPPADGKPPRKDKQQKPMSRKITTGISQCSAKMTEILSWQSKLVENKNGLKPVLTNMFFFGELIWVHP